MRSQIISLVATCIALPCLAVEQTPPVRSALKLLPKEADSRLALVEGRDGAPNPSRWHFVVYDPESQNGLREYVVSGGEVSAIRELSQFADHVSPEAIVGGQVIKVDSNELALMARERAVASGREVASFNYDFSKDPDTGSGIWRIACLDKSGAQIGRLTVDSMTGKTLSENGFAPVAQSVSRPPAIAEGPPADQSADAADSSQPVQKSKRSRSASVASTSERRSTEYASPYDDGTEYADPDDNGSRDNTRSSRHTVYIRRTVPSPVETVHRIIHGIFPF